MGLTAGFVVIASFCTVGALLSHKYHSNDELGVLLREFSSNFSDISTVYSIGRSVKGVELLVIAFSAAKRYKENVPNVKLVANIHGNEAVGREILLQFIDFLGYNYKKDPKVTWLLKHTRIHILPSMNPDGFVISNPGICAGDYGRKNARKVDLNRNFPDQYHVVQSSEQPETLAIRKWMNSTDFILSASLHSGALVVNYPFDSEKEPKWQIFVKQYLNANASEEIEKLRRNYIDSLPVNLPSLTPDDDIFKHLASAYAYAHPTMHRGVACSDSLVFKGGITNGAEWYPLIGGMQDYNYVAHNCMELTLELSCCKYPLQEELPRLWDENKMALLNFCMNAHIGVAGVVINSTTKAGIKGAKLKVLGRNVEFSTNSNGEFRRILLPGKYKLEINYLDSVSKVIPFEIFPTTTKYPKATFLRIQLENDTFYQSDMFTTPSFNARTNYGNTTVKSTITTTLTTTALYLQPQNLLAKSTGVKRDFAMQQLLFLLFTTFVMILL